MAADGREVGGNAGWFSRQNLLIAAIFVIAAAYLAQAGSFIRHSQDGDQYLNMAFTIVDGQGFTVQGRPAHFPPGYPLLLAAMMRNHVLDSWQIIGANLAGIAAGTVAAFFVFRRRLGFSTDGALTCCVLTLLSWVLVKHVTQVLSDCPYYGVSMAALLTMIGLEDSRGGKRGALVVLSLVLVGLAILTRAIGIALIPAFAWALLGSRGRAWFIGTRGGRMAMAGGVVVLLVLGLVVFPRTIYGQEGIATYRGGGLVQMVGATVVYRLTEFGSLGINFPHGPLFAAAGAVVLAMLAYGGWLASRPMTCVTVYAMGYFGIISIWPFADQRLWIPVIPILVGYGWFAMRKISSLRGEVRHVGTAYGVAFALLGVAALGYSTWITYSGDRFEERYGHSVPGLQEGSREFGGKTPGEVPR